MKKNKRNSSQDSVDSMPSLHSVTETDDDDDDYDGEQVRQRERPGVPRSPPYRVSELIPLSTSPEWDEINTSLNIYMTGSDSLMGLCDEARFARSRLKETMSVLLEGPTQAKAALFCIKQIQSEDITKELQIAFAKLLPHSLFHAEQSPELKAAIHQLRTQSLIYQRLPVETRKAITDYLPSTSGSKTATQTGPNVSSTRPHPSDSITKSLTQSMSQKPSTTLNSSTTRRTGQRSSSSAQSPSSAGSVRSEHLNPQAQPVPPTSQTKPSPSVSQRASTASRAPPKAKNTSRESSLSTTAQKHSTVSQTPKEPSNDSPPATPDLESSTAPGPSTALQSALGSSHPSKSSTTSSQGPSGRKKRGKGRGKGRWK